MLIHSKYNQENHSVHTIYKKKTFKNIFINTANKYAHFEKKFQNFISRCSCSIHIVKKLMEMEIKSSL